MSWEFWKSGTFWTALAGVVGGIGALITGVIELTAFFQLILALLLTVFVRKGIHKAGVVAGKKAK